MMKSTSRRWPGRLVAGLLLLLLGAAPLALAEKKCDPKPVKVKGSELRGQIFSAGPGERTPLSGVSVDLLEQKSKRLVASAGSFEGGYFLIKDVEPGDYWMRTTHPAATGIEVELKLERPDSAERPPDRAVIFFLGMDEAKPCGGGRVETQKIK